ncbi:hypothetical protein HZC30_03990 [Candidatus Woesearchaeota archaeon]|nr:hypothetical protein [Candidatus Woesearchaeota archaeon]
MKPKKIEIRKRTRTQVHLVEKIGVAVVVLALVVLIGALMLGFSWEKIVFSGSSITGAAVEESLITAGGMGVLGSGSGELGIQADANSTSCGNVTGSLTLTANITTTTTCFTINASNIVLDCAGFTVTGDKGSDDYAVTKEESAETPLII